MAFVEATAWKGRALIAAAAGRHGEWEFLTAPEREEGRGMVVSSGGSDVLCCMM
jgi:hypothetical protein